MNTKTYDELLEEMKESAIASNSGITDFNEGSNIMTIFESVARPIEQAYIDARNGYANNLRAIPYAVFDFKPKDGERATVNLIFTRNTALQSVSTIPVGTRVSNGSLVFITSVAGTIASGETSSNSISATAENVGLEYNLKANTITTIESTLSAEIISVTNPSAAIGGTNAETQSQTLNRFKIWINGLQGSNKYGIMAGVLNNPRVRSVSIAEHFPPKSDIYNMTVYVDNGTGLLPDDLKNEIIDTINGNDTAENPGLKAAGINVDVSAATPLIIDISLMATIYRAEEARVRNDITETLQDYINGLGIHENVVLSTLIVILKQIPGITDVTSLTANGSSSNIEVGVNVIARFGSVTMTVISQ